MSDELRPELEALRRRIEARERVHHPGAAVIILRGEAPTSAAPKPSVLRAWWAALLAPFVPRRTAPMRRTDDGQDALELELLRLDRVTERADNDV